ncbi:Molybdopterin synthase catalytic subunit [Alcanivorax sp. ALC70]|nr:Molybdopterin synthase catalytic subunit [Alcanivorax sp. ALC70]
MTAINAETDIRVAIIAEPLEGVPSVEGQDGRSGAEVRFSGRVRDESGRVRALFLEHYPGMTENALTRIAEHARERWPLNAIEIIHRIGEIQVGEEIVRVVVWAGHRHAAFEACAFLMDILKSQVPLWKKELNDDGWHWVEARERDAEAAARWMGAASERAR